jgi:hypothetical protein
LTTLATVKIFVLEEVGSGLWFLGAFFECVEFFNVDF